MNQSSPALNNKVSAYYVFLIALVTMAVLWMPVQVGAIPMDQRLFAGEGPWVVRVYGVDSVSMTELQADFDVWAGNSDDAYAIIGIKNRDELTRIRSLGFTVAVDPVATERYRSPLVLGFGTDTIPNFPCYRTVEETFAAAQQIVNDHAELAELIDIGDSWEKTQDGNTGYDLWVLKLTNQNIVGTKPKLFVMSAIHARELTTAELITRFAEYLVQSYGTDADVSWILDHHEIHLLLQSNPDGRKQAETGQFWRKNVNNNHCGNTSSRGADLNRNFPWEWGGAASTNPCSDTYQGPTPASEPEVSSVVDYVRSVFPDQREEAINIPAPLDSTGMFIDVHSFSQLVLWPYGFSNSAGQAPNQDQLSTLGRRLAFFNGYRPQQILGLTAASGSTADFAYGELGVAAYAFELGTEFFQQCNVFESAILEQNMAALLYAAKVPRTPYMTPSGPDITAVRLDNNSVIQGRPNVDLLVTADGTRFSTINDATSPLENPRQIAGVNLYLNTLPWQGQPTQTAAAVDGVFDTSVEDATAVLDISSINTGQHTVFVEAVGADNQTGPLTSEFLYVLDAASAAEVSGVIRIENSADIIQGATIETEQFRATSDNQGQYRLALLPGSYQIAASAMGSSSLPVDITVQAGESLSLDFALPNRCDVFNDDVEQGVNGWTTTGNWAIVTEQANSPTHAWHDSPGAQYPNNSDTWLRSPVIDLSLASQAQLRFSHICDTEATFDFGIVEISSDNTNWQEVYRCDDQLAWQEQVIDISALDGEANARVRFRLDTDVTQRDNGWYIDDIQINAASSACPAENPEVILMDGFEVL